MDLDKLEKLATLVLNEMPNIMGSATGGFAYYPEHSARFRNLMVVAGKTLPEYGELFTSAIRSIQCINDAKSVICHLLEILKIEKESNSLIKEMKIFDSVDEKMKQANICFQNEDYPSVLHSLNTSLELVLKDKVGIPTTITNINTSNIIDILIKNKIEPYLFLVEARKYVLNIDNKIKHTGYSPSKTDCIMGKKAMEELIKKLRNTKLELSEELRNKIFEGL